MHMESSLENKVVVTVAVTGSAGDRSTPRLPITPEEIADSALAAHEAGAAVAHIHVRDVATGKASMDLALYREVVQRIRDRSDMVVNLSTGAGGRFIPEDGDPIAFGAGTTLASPVRRIAHVLDLKPEICSLDIGTLNFDKHVFVNFGMHVAWMAEQIRDAGVKPELEVFEIGHIEYARHLLDTDRVSSPPLFQLCMGVRWGMPATVRNLIAMQSRLPADAVWSAFGVAAAAYPMVAQAVLLGGCVRVGMEDNLYLEKGKRAESNRQLVEKAVHIIRALGKQPADSSEARRILHL